jgi:hypothetical protein
MIPLLLAHTSHCTRWHKQETDVENQHIKMECVMYEPKHFMYCIKLPDTI